MASYWEKRLQEQQEALYDKTLAQEQKQLAKYYKQALKDTENDIGALYDRLLEAAEDGKVKVNDLYRYNRYFEIRGNLNKRLKELGKKEIELNYKGFEGLYNVTSKAVGENLSLSSFSLSQKQGAEKVLESVWCADGKHWSERIWDNQQILQKKIEKGLVDSVSRGVPKDELVANLANSFTTGFNNADRIVRTELTHVQNTAAADRYKDAGIESYRFLAAIDNRTSEICEELDGQEFKFIEAMVGVNMPPMHPNCRSTIIPVLDN